MGGEILQGEGPLRYRDLDFGNSGNSRNFRYPTLPAPGVAELQKPARAGRLPIRGFGGFGGFGGGETRNPGGRNSGHRRGASNGGLAQLAQLAQSILGSFLFRRGFHGLERSRGGLGRDDGKHADPPDQDRQTYATTLLSS